MKKNDRENLLKKYTEGDKYDVTVQEVDEEYKKIILIMDLGIEMEQTDNINNNTNLPNDEAQDKIEIPQDVIDSIDQSDNSQDEEENNK